jgi:hypothetical protein
MASVSYAMRKFWKIDSISKLRMNAKAVECDIGTPRSDVAGGRRWTVVKL